MISFTRVPLVPTLISTSEAKALYMGLSIAGIIPRRIIPDFPTAGEEVAMMGPALSRMVLFCVLTIPTMALAQSGPSTDLDDYRISEVTKTKELAIHMFTEFLNENIVTLRVSAMLRHCHQEGLAKAVEAKQIDRRLTDKLQKLILEGRFDNLPHYAIFEAQAAASLMITAYNFGLLEGLRLLDNSNTTTCPAAVDGANKLLEK
jgi:hypothetical protein